MITKRGLHWNQFEIVVNIMWTVNMYELEVDLCTNFAVHRNRRYQHHHIYQLDSPTINETSESKKRRLDSIIRRDMFSAEWNPVAKNASTRLFTKEK